MSWYPIIIVDIVEEDVAIRQQIFDLLLEKFNIEKDEYYENSASFGEFSISNNIEYDEDKGVGNTCAGISISYGINFSENMITLLPKIRKLVGICADIEQWLEEAKLNNKVLFNCTVHNI